MKSFLMAVTLVLLWLFLYDYADGKELPKEMSMKTDVGEVVLTTEECIFIKMGLRNYPYAAYATEKGKANHEGCWRKASIPSLHFTELNQVRGNIWRTAWIPSCKPMLGTTDPYVRKTKVCVPIPNIDLRHNFV